jgi:hypothetical protein
VNVGRLSKKTIKTRENRKNRELTTRADILRKICCDEPTALSCSEFVCPLKNKLFTSKPIRSIYALISALHSIENCLAMLSIKLPQKNFFGIKWLCYPRREHMPTDYLFYATSKTEQFYVEAKLEQFSRWGAPREQRDEVTADIGKLVFQGLQTLQTERTIVREPQLFSWNGSKQGIRVNPSNPWFNLEFLEFFDVR